jgi:predicted nucleic acid-binding protein
MRFWDSSALVPLLLDELASPSMVAEYLRDPEQIAWWATGIECVSALARAEREGRIAPAIMADAVGRLEALEVAWAEVQPTDQLRELAVRLTLRVHALRTPDALQLAAALVAAEGHPGSLTLVSLDVRLALAAEREGLRVIRPTA